MKDCRKVINPCGSSGLQVPAGQFQHLQFGSGHVSHIRANLHDSIININFAR
jgi:hypothetical protein